MTTPLEQAITDAADERHESTFPRSPLGATDLLDPDNLGLRDLREAARRVADTDEDRQAWAGDTRDESVPAAPICPVCGSLYGAWSPVHSKPGQDRPCSWSWDVQKRRGAR